MARIDISREIGNIRAMRDLNFLASALQRIQDSFNGLVIPTASVPAAPATSQVVAQAIASAPAPSFPTNAVVPLSGDVTGNNQSSTVVSTHLSAPLPLAQGGTAADLSATGGASEYVKQSSAGGALSVGKIALDDLPWSVNTVAFSATPAFDVSRGNVQEITLTGNITSFTITNAVAGQVVKFIWIQDATGGRTVAGAPANVHGFTAPGTTASTWSIQTMTYDGTNWICEAANVNIA